MSLITRKLAELLNLNKLFGELFTHKTLKLLHNGYTDKFSFFGRNVGNGWASRTWKNYKENENTTIKY
jgi:hypothetical protein